MTRIDWATHGPKLLEALQVAEAALFRLGMTCEQWAQESVHGGWSTHQVKANRATCSDALFAAGRARAAIAAAKGEDRT